MKVARIATLRPGMSADSLASMMGEKWLPPDGYGRVSGTSSRGFGARVDAAVDDQYEALPSSSALSRWKWDAQSRSTTYAKNTRQDFDLVGSIRQLTAPRLANT